MKTFTITQYAGLFLPQNVHFMAWKEDFLFSINIPNKKYDFLFNLKINKRIRLYTSLFFTAREFFIFDGSLYPFS